MKKTPSKDNNQFKIDYAFPGLCSLCHCEVAEFKGSKEYAPGISRPVISKLKPNYHEAQVELSDSTLMTVALCTDCFYGFTPEDSAALMESEINGWNAEMPMLNLPEEKKKEYMSQQTDKFITNRTDKPWTLGEIKRINKPSKSRLTFKKAGK